MARNTELRSEYLKFIRQYIDGNHCAPRLEEIAQHFSVTEPAAHKMLSSLEKAGELYFDRDSVTGFYIRLFDWVGNTAQPSEIVIAGGFDREGVIHDFPQKHGHFPVVLPGFEREKLFALQAWHHIHQLDIMANDLLIFYQDQEPLVGGICIIPDGEIWKLVRLVGQEEERQFYWMPIDSNNNEKDSNTVISRAFLEESGSIENELILASVLLLKRTLTL